MDMGIFSCRADFGGKDLGIDLVILIYQKIGISKPCVLQTITLYNANNKIESPEAISDPEQARTLLANMEAIENEIAALKAELKKENQFNRQMDLNVRIKELEKNIFMGSV